MTFRSEFSELWPGFCKGSNHTLACSYATNVKFSRGSLGANIDIIQVYQPFPIFTARD